MQRKWYEILQQLANAPDFYETTAATYYYHTQLVNQINRYTRGRVLDLGCGRQTYRPFLLQAGGTDYTGVDIVAGVNGVDALASGDALPFKNASFDTVFCTQVLEHVPNPWTVASEISRILNAEGHLILSVPFFYFLHDEPYDFYRYTPHGVQKLFEQAGLQSVNISTAGGLFGMASEFAQMGILVAGYTLRPIWPLVWKGNKLYNRTAAAVDNRTSAWLRLPMNVLAVMKKPSI